MSTFLIVSASSTLFPLIHSVASDDDAIAEPQPNVLNFASSMTPASFTLIWRRITSPHAGAPTSPVPTFGSSLSSVPTLRGFSACSMTFSLYAMASSVPQFLSLVVTAPASLAALVRRPLDGLQIDPLCVHLVDGAHVAEFLHL